MGDTGRCGTGIWRWAWRPWKTRPSLLALFIHQGVWIPRDLQARLRVFVPEPGPAEIATRADLPAAVELAWSEFDHRTRTSKTRTEEVPLVQQETATPALHDILTVLRLVEAGKVGVSGKTGRVTSAGAKAILESLHSGDFCPVEKVEAASDTMRPFAWPLILQAAGLAAAAGSRLRLIRAGVKALSSPPHEVIRSAWDRWLESTLLDEFSRIDAIKGQRGGGLRGMTAAADRRQAIATPWWREILDKTDLPADAIAEYTADGRQARFFTLVSRETREEDFARHRQLFLTEQGYSYRLELLDKDSG